MKGKIIELFAESVLVQALLALTFSVAIIALLFLGKEVPEELWAILGIIIGFYFGTKSQQQAQKIAMQIKEKK